MERHTKDVIAISIVVGYFVVGTLLGGILDGAWVLTPFLLALLFGAGVLYLYAGALPQWHTTFVPEPEIVFITTGEEKVYKILHNIPGYHLNGEGKLEPNENQVREQRDDYRYADPIEDSNIFLRLLWRYLGVRWVSFLWPMVHAYRFTISQDKLRDQTEMGDDPKLFNRIVADKGEVGSLWWKAPRPVWIQDVELGGDGSRLNLLIQVRIQIVDPVKVVFTWQANFYPLIDQAVEATVNNFCQEFVYRQDEERSHHLTYAWFKQFSKGAESSFIGVFTKGLNGKRYNTDIPDDELTEAKQQQYGDVGQWASTDILETYGVQITDAELVGWECADETTQRLADAMLEEERVAAEMRGLRQRGKGEADYEEEKSKGESKRWQKNIASIVNPFGETDEHGRAVRDVDGKTAAELLRSTEVADAKVNAAKAYADEKSPINTLVVGNDGATPTVPLNNNRGDQNA